MTALRDFLGRGDWGRWQPVTLCLVAWLLSGLALSCVRVRGRLAWYATLGVALHGVVYGPALAAFEVLNLAVYAFAAAAPAWARRSVGRVPRAATVPAGAGAEPPGAEDGRAAERVWRLCCLGILALVGVALVGRERQWQERLAVAVGAVSVPLFCLDFLHLIRLVTFLYEVGAGIQPVPPLGEYLLWVNLPPPGMILRPSQFAAQRDALARRPAWRDIGAPAQMRFLAAGVGKLGLAALFAGVRPDDLAPQHPLVYKVAAVFLFGPWSFVLLSAGLNDVWCFIGGTWNLRVPIAWNAPFVRTNLSQFWANWNMTLMAVFRDYLFFNRWGLARPNLYLNTVIVFLTMGVWHALNWYWVLFGALHAAGFCAFLWFQQYKRRHPERWAEPTRVGRFAAWLVTYGFVCLCWYVPSKLVTWLGL